MNDKRNQMQETWPNGRTGRPLQTRWGEKPYYSLDYYLKETFGQKVYKLALDGGMTCPSRDGTLGTGGSIFRAREVPAILPNRLPPPAQAQAAERSRRLGAYLRLFLR